MIFFKTFDDIFTFNNLWKAYKHCLRGCRWKFRNQKFVSQDVINITKLLEELKNGTYKIDKFNEFTIRERGKLRNISSHSFKDRIVQKCLCDYYLVPLLSQSLIYDCGATLKNKGISFQRKRVIHHLNNYRLKYGNEGYVLTIDIHHYFDCIDHNKLLEMLKERIVDERILHLIKLILDSKEPGLSLGSQVSQICALFYLNKVDHFIKEKLRVKYYGRYMDDMYLISNDKKFLYKCFDEIVDKLHSLGLVINQSKSKVHFLKNGFVFLKTRYKICDGKIIKLLTTKTFQSMSRKIKKGIDTSNILPSWLDYLSNFNCYNKFKKFEKLYLKEVNYE